MNTENFSSFKGDESTFEQEVLKIEELPAIAQEPIVEEPIVEEPKAEEPKAEEPKAEESIKEINKAATKSSKINNSDLIVIYAMRDLTKDGAVNLKKGYNKISKSDYANWQNSKAIRLASSEEIATYLK